LNKNNLLSIAGGFWGIMGLFLIYRSFDLYQLAMIEQSATLKAVTISVLCGLIIGGIKGKFVFSKTARKNKTRIEGLEAPHKPHHAFGNKFYILVPGMILLGYLLRHYNEYLGGYIVVGAIYCGIGSALAVSSLFYWVGDSKIPVEENP
jgi:hypothetical protein